MERQENCWDFDVTACQANLSWFALRVVLSTFTCVAPKIFAWIGKCRMRFTREHQSCSRLWLEEQVPCSSRHHSLGLEGGTRAALSSGVLDTRLFCCQLSSSALGKTRLFLCNKIKVE